MWRSICSVAIWPPRMEIEFHLIVVTFLFIDFCWLKEVPRLTAFICIPRERELWIFKCVVVWSLKEAAQICYRCVSTLIMSADLLCDHWVSWECTTSVHIWVVFVKVDICVKTSDNVAERAKPEGGFEHFQSADRWKITDTCRLFKLPGQQWTGWGDYEHTFVLKQWLTINWSAAQCHESCDTFQTSASDTDIAHKLTHHASQLWVINKSQIKKVRCDVREHFDGTIRDL